VAQAGYFTCGIRSIRELFMDRNMAKQRARENRTTWFGTENVFLSIPSMETIKNVNHANGKGIFTYCSIQVFLANRGVPLLINREYHKVFLNYPILA
jgi:hypothetical protein